MMLIWLGKTVTINITNTLGQNNVSVDVITYGAGGFNTNFTPDLMENIMWSLFLRVMLVIIHLQILK
ncbi:MAG: hypothetical protein LBT66_00010 [Methanobrevibacter sp.]|jgi:hypothetical protein|nr:hypothetical protein [Candidatus Methanovirga meridionalis]